MEPVHREILSITVRTFSCTSTEVENNRIFSYSGKLCALGMAKITMWTNLYIAFNFISLS